MKTNGTVYVVAAFTLIAAFIVYQLWFSDTRRIFRRLREIEIALSVPAQETEAARLVRLASLRRSLAPSMQIQSAERHLQIRSRDEVLAVAGAWRAPVDVHFLDVQIGVRDKDNAADVYLTMEISRQGKDQETIPFAVTVGRQDGEWVVTWAAFQPAAR